MATAQEIANAERRSLNLDKNGPVTTFNPRDTSTTSFTRDAGLAGYGSSGTAYKLPGENNVYSSVLSGPAALTHNQVAGIVGGGPPRFGGTTPTGPQTEMNSMTELLNSLLGGGGSKGPSASDILARNKFDYEKKQDALNRAEALEALQFGRNKDAKIGAGYTDFYGGGQGAFNTGFDKLLGMITDQGKVSNDAVTDAYTRAKTNLDAGYTAAQGLGDTGFSALNTYLSNNPNNPYANMNAQVGSAPDALSQYLSAYGVSDAPVQGQIQADQLQAQQGAGNFQNLIDVLSAVAQQGASSRGAESEMAQNLFNTGLGQDRAGYRTQAENAQAQALSQLQQAMSQSKFGVQENRNNLANQLAMAVINAGGNLNIPPATTELPVETKLPVKTQLPVTTQLPDPRLLNGQLPTAGNMYEGPGQFNTDIANMPAAEQREALDRIESYTPETFNRDTTEEQRKALQQLLASMGLG